MRIASGVRLGRVAATGLALVFGGGALPSPVEAADPIGLQGTWKISAPQVSFKPADGPIPFTPAGRTRYEQNKLGLTKGDFAYDTATSSCASPGLPRLMLTPDRFRIWQRPGYVLFQFEWNRLFREIDMGGLMQPQLRVAQGLPDEGENNDALVGRAAPIAHGHWEGRTLVLTTDGFNDKTLVDNLLPHGYGMKTIERIRLRSPDVLEDSITVADPEYFTRPWRTVVTYRRQKDTEFPENVCLLALFASRTAAQPPPTPLAKLEAKQP